MNVVIKVLVVVVLFQSTIFASEWSWIIKCHSKAGGTIIDRNIYNRGLYQIVIADKNAIKQFIDSSAIFEGQINKKGEFITNLYSGMKDNFHYTLNFKGIRRKYLATYFNGALLIEAFAIAEDGRTTLYKIDEKSFHYCN